MAIELRGDELDAVLGRINRGRGGSGDERAYEVEMTRALGAPEHGLVVYGTLAPGRENHHLLAALAGSWSEVTIAGELGDWTGYPMFRPSMTGPPVPAWLLRSVELPDHWARLDEFETAAYARHLVRYETSTASGVANCYVEARTRS